MRARVRYALGMSIRTCARAWIIRGSPDTPVRDVADEDAIMSVEEGGVESGRVRYHTGADTRTAILPD